MATIALLSAMVFVGCDVTVGMRDDLYALYYTSADGEVVYPTPEGFDGHILSNTYEKGLGKITFDRPITRVGDSAFRYCTSLTSITIPDSVTSIGECAFYDCTSLTSITLPESVILIGRYAFYGCTALVEVYCEGIEPPTGALGMLGLNGLGRKIYVPEESVEAYKTAEYWSEYADAFVPYDFEKGEDVEEEENPENRKIYYTSTDGNVVTPYRSGTSYFGANIISNTYADGQGVITFDGNVTSIGDSAFSYCSSLTSVTIPDSVTSIGDSAFRDCTSLTRVTISDSVTSIGYYAFQNCSSLTSVTIGNGVTSIGDSAFRYCTSLTSVYCKPTTPPEWYFGYSWEAFHYNASGRKIYVPTDSVDAYKTANGWSAYADAIVGYSF